MSNTFITPTAIANMALPALRENMVLGSLVYTDFDTTVAKHGDTVTVRKPATFTAEEFDGTNWNAQTVTEGSVAVVMDKVLSVPMEITSKEQSLNIVDFTAQVINPACQALASKIDALIAGLYVDIPYYQLVSSTPVVSDIIGVMTALNINKAPLGDRALVMDPVTYGDYIGLEQFSSAEKTGDTLALRNASMGSVFGLDAYMDQNIANHTGGAGTVLVDLVAGYAAGLSAIHVDGVTTKLVPGDLLTIGGYQYVVTSGSALTGTDQDLSIYPALKADIANDDPVTIKTTAYQSLGFHRNAFGLAVRPLDAPMGGANSAIVSAEGLSIRVVEQYDIKTKKNLVSLDILCGVKTLTPELAVRLVR